MVELNSGAEGGFQPSYASWRNSTVQGQRPGWQFLLDRVDGPSIGGHVTSSATGAPLQAELSLDEMTVYNGEVYFSEATYGRYHFIVVPGTYHLRVRAPGYREKSVTVTVASTTAVTNVALDPEDGVVFFRESFELDTPAWTVGGVGDDATQGQWVRADPYGSRSGTLPSPVTWAAPEFDRSTWKGTKAYVTGNAAAPSFGASDVDGGVTSLTSPVINAAAYYGAQLSYQRRFYKTGFDAQDLLTAEISGDGGVSWTQLEQVSATTATATQTPAYVGASFLLDTRLPLTNIMKLRFRAADRSPDSTIEAAVDEITITGIPRSSGLVGGLSVSDPGNTVIAFNAVPGAVTYDVLRGDLSQLQNAGSTINLGQVTLHRERLHRSRHERGRRRGDAGRRPGVLLPGAVQPGVQHRLVGHRNGEPRARPGPDLAAALRAVRRR